MSKLGTNFVNKSPLWKKLNKTSQNYIKALHFPYNTNKKIIIKNSNTKKMILSFEIYDFKS